MIRAIGSENINRGGIVNLALPHVCYHTPLGDLKTRYPIANTIPPHRESDRIQSHQETP